MDAAADAFSCLPDELLLRILRFAPHTAGAATTAVSRRWRPLWTSCGAINLVALIPEDDVQHMMEPDAFFANRDRFLAAAVKVLDAFANVPVPVPVPVTKLTIRVEGHTANIVRDFLNREANFRRRPQVLARFLDHPAASAVEELIIAGVDNVGGKPMLFETIDSEAVRASFRTRMYSINVQSLPSATLRVLDLTNCGELALSPVVFPHLWKLRLRHCELLLGGLQSFIDSAPLLSSIQLESVLLEDNTLLEAEVPTAVRPLRCPAATTLGIYNCCLKEEGTLQIFAPNLQHFGYKGVLRHIELSPPPEGLLHVDMIIVDYPRKEGRDPTAATRHFWGNLHGFTHVKQVSLRIRLLKGFTVTSQGIALPVLANIERLNLSLVFSPTSKRAAAFITDLLSCCPALRHLRVNLTTDREDTVRGPEYCAAFLERKFQKDLNISMERLNMSDSLLEAGLAASPHDDFQASKRPRMQQEPHFFDELSELPGLGAHHLECLHSSLKTVALQFQQGEKSVYGVGLVKFFAENAKVLDEMLVDAGYAKLRDHLSFKIAEWVAGWSERRRFKIMPLKRQN